MWTIQFIQLSLIIQFIHLIQYIQYIQMIPLTQFTLSILSIRFMKVKFMWDIVTSRLHHQC